MMRCPLPLTLASLASNWLQEQAAALYRLNMEQYASLKGQLLAATAVGVQGRMSTCLAWRGSEERPLGKRGWCVRHRCLQTNAPGCQSLPMLPL